MSASRLLIAVAAAACVAAPAAATAAQSPHIAEHAIFSGGARAPWHVGQVLDVLVTSADGRKVAKVCWSPAPIDRPACGPGNQLGAPSAAGTTTLEVTLDDGTRLTKSVRVVRARSRYDGQVPVPGRATCRETRLYGSAPRGHARFRGALASAPAHERLALYNHVGPRAIFAWDYATNRGGFASAACVA